MERYGCLRIAQNLYNHLRILVAVAVAVGWGHDPFEFLTDGTIGIVPTFKNPLKTQIGISTLFWRPTFPA